MYCPTTCGGETRGTRTVTLTFLRPGLIYDIRNYAYIEGHMMPDEQQCEKHTTIDIGEEGNIDRVRRVLDIGFAEVAEALYPLAKADIEGEEVNDSVSRGDGYILMLGVTEEFSRTTIELLSKYIHEYLVAKVVADWLSMSKPEAYERWRLKMTEAMDGIREAKMTHRGCFTRQISPF